MRHFVTRTDINSFGHEVQGRDISRLNRLYWRGDSRGPKDIFNFGFRRRDDTAEGYFNRQQHWQTDEAGSDSEDDDVLDVPQKMPNSQALFRIAQKDIAPATAVCVAGSFRAAALFPLKGNGAKDVIWVYAVNVENGFDTYQMQAQVGAEKLLFVQEACSHDIPPMHVLGVVTVRRNWLGTSWEAGAIGKVLKPFAENSKSIGCVGRAGKLDAARQEIAQALLGNKFMIGA